MFSEGALEWKLEVRCGSGRGGGGEAIEEEGRHVGVEGRGRRGRGWFGRGGGGVGVQGPLAGRAGGEGRVSQFTNLIGRGFFLGITMAF